MKERTRRRKRDKEGEFVIRKVASRTTTRKPKKQSKSLKKHGSDTPSGGVEALLPSLIGLTILACGAMAKMGFRGRASVAGIDLGTTNSVICVQAQTSGGKFGSSYVLRRSYSCSLLTSCVVGEITCIPDPITNSSIVPSVVSFLPPWERPKGKKEPSDLDPHPSYVVVGDVAKRRIETHPLDTFYHGKRVIGRPTSSEAVRELQAEVEFEIGAMDNDVVFNLDQGGSRMSIPPYQIGSYVVNHLLSITSQFLGHDNIKSAVIAVPAKFDARQRQETAEAFKRAGMTVSRILEEPVAAALAYGLHKKEGVDHILVYDFGGGTLDVSLLYVTDGFADVLGSDGDDQLGGADFDTAISHHLWTKVGGEVDAVTRASQTLVKESDNDIEENLSRFCPMLQSSPLCSLSALHTVGEKLKISLSSYPDGNGVAEATCMTTRNLKPSNYDDLCRSLVPVTLSLTSEDFDTIAKPLYDRSVLPVERLLRDLGIDSEEIDEVVMVGGTTRMPQIRALVKETMGVQSLNTHIDPDITVAVGAASVID